LEEFEPLLREYWVNKHIPFDNVTNEKLKNPTEVLPILVERFLHQKNLFENHIPPEKDLGLFRMKFTDLKRELTISPRDCLATLRQILPRTVKERVAECTAWMNTQRLELKVAPENVDEFVKQIQSLEYVEDNFQTVKEKLELADRVFGMLQEFDMLSREER